ncbi:melanoma-associated antigen D2-like [Osmia bicornis bicornis]|uniref:melanoma-associated antigen D2-like n=1 Tax=Osmia bicornis bicornis TaxID=1437191 RepID=UPI0010F66254|nr:melanoma-associated antigen D2-like [Osmia bicornis bicornis]
MELRNRRSILSQKNLSQSSNNRQSNDGISFSQPIPSTSRRTRGSINFSQRLDESPKRMLSEDQNELVNSLIRYLLVLDREKQVVSKAHLVKNVFNNGGRQFHPTLNKAKILLSKIFGYQLVELPGNKYILVNEIRNEIPHIYPTAEEGRQQVLLFMVLTHIFMQEESCTEETLWSFLTNLEILRSDNQDHDYFGNVKQLITEVFVAQRYLEKVVTNSNDAIEYKWGPRAEHEFSRRSALEFVSEIYCGREIKSWALQYKTLLAREQAKKSQ